jgi:mRNA interferase MazF
METNTRKVKRGEIYYYDFGNNEGSVQNGVRPVMVVQCEEGNQASMTTVVAAITSVIKKQYMPSHIILGDRFGLSKPSMVLLEQLKTINQAELQHYVGIVDDPDLVRMINSGLKKALGLWVYKPRQEADVRCLCVNCLKDYMESSDFVIRRLNPFDREKGKCDKCSHLGYDYILTVRGRSKQGGTANV